MEQEINDSKITDQNNNKRNELKGILEDEFNKLRNDPSYKLASRATKVKGYLYKKGHD